MIGRFVDSRRSINVDLLMASCRSVYRYFVTYLFWTRVPVQRPEKNVEVRCYQATEYESTVSGMIIVMKESPSEGRWD